MDETWRIERDELQRRLDVLRRNLKDLRKDIRQARPIDVPSLTASLHLLEAIAAGELSLAERIEERNIEYALRRGVVLALRSR